MFSYLRQNDEENALLLQKRVECRWLGCTICVYIISEGYSIGINALHLSNIQRSGT
jgi:hypothetical protein